MRIEIKMKECSSPTSKWIMLNETLDSEENVHLGLTMSSNFIECKARYKINVQKVRHNINQNKQTNK